MHIFLHFWFLRVETQKFLYNPTAMCFFFLEGRFFRADKCLSSEINITLFQWNVLRGLLFPNYFFFLWLFLSWGLKFESYGKILNFPWLKHSLFKNWRNEIKILFYALCPSRDQNSCGLHDFMSNITPQTRITTIHKIVNNLWNLG